MPRSNAPGGLTSFGVPVMPGIPMPYTGNFYFVDPVNGSDNYPGTSADRPFASLYMAHSKCKAGNNDCVFLIGNGAAASAVGANRLSLAGAQAVDSTVTAGTLVWSKNATHLIGIGAPGANSCARIAPPTGTYTMATFGSGNLVTVTASGCTFANISAQHKFSTGGAAMICWTDSGGKNTYDNCQFLGANDTYSATHTDSRSLLLTTAGENVFRNCTIGDNATTRTVANASLEFAGATFNNNFINCVFPFMTSNAGVLGILGTGAACMGAHQLFDGCKFLNELGASSTQMTVLASMTNGSPGGMLVFDRCISVGQTKFGDTNALAVSYINMSAVSAAAGGLALNPS